MKFAHVVFATLIPQNVKTTTNILYSYFFTMASLQNKDLFTCLCKMVVDNICRAVVFARSLLMEFEGLRENKKDLCVCGFCKIVVDRTNCISTRRTISWLLVLNRARDICRWYVWDFDPKGSLIVV